MRPEKFLFSILDFYLKNYEKNDYESINNLTLLIQTCFPKLEILKYLIFSCLHKKKL